jgi:hypothetical protein
VHAERVRARRAAGRDADAKTALRQLAEFLDGRSADPAASRATNATATTAIAFVAKRFVDLLEILGGEN